MTKSVMIAKRYRLLKHIGKGGMADVYLALDTVLNREVAIKILKGDLSSDPVALERFKREAQASTRLSHVNIVDIYDVGDDGENHYIVMEYIKGKTLKKLIQQRGSLYYPEAISMMKQMCSAIMESHRNGIIHRDIKSQNVLIKDDGTVKIVDFGIALANNAMQITGQDNVLGSVHYISPEVAKGDIATMQSDIYSLGIVFYEILCGDVPFKGDSAIQVVMDAIKKPIPYVRNYDKKIPQSVENIVLKATAKNPKNRYLNVADMLKDLNECLLEKHKNDERIKFAFSEDLNLRKGDIDKKTKVQKPKKKKVNSTVVVALISLVVALSAIIFLILYSLGIVHFGPRSIIIPDILNKRILEASEILNENGLTLDLTNIERELTEDVEEGLIIEVYPSVGEEVEEGTSIRVVVSDGMYAIMENYVGQNIDTVRTTLSNNYPNIRIVLEEIAASQDPGTILSQTGMDPNMQFDPSEANTVYFTISAYVSDIIPDNLLGSTQEEAQAILEDMGIKSALQAISLDELNEYSDEEKEDLVAGTIVRTDPEVGTSYRQTSDSFVTLYYLEIE